MYNPVSTYRLQFSKSFTLKDLHPLVGYLSKLNVKTIYASPILQATSGSEHGYDVINPFNIHPDIGNEKQLHNIAKKLTAKNMGWLQDIVPNHMAYTPENPWMYDILEKGKTSIYADYFDIDWNYQLDKKLNGKISLPFFGDEIDYLIKNREIALTIHPDKGLMISYFDNDYPVSMDGYHFILQRLDSLPKEVGQAIDNLLHQSERIEFYHQADHLKNTFLALFKENKAFQASLNTTLEQININEQALYDVIGLQHYLTEYWEHTNKRINYRRFFTINDMICLNQEKPHVFENYHKYILQMLEKGVYQGLRIDHIDGMFFPGEYLNRLRSVVGEETYVIVEKILEKDEQIPSYWPVQGTTGYHFLALCNNLLTNNDASPIFQRLHEEMGAKRGIGYDEHAYNKKKFILYKRMLGELNNLVYLCTDMKIIDNVPDESLLKEAIAEILIQCPVYKLYFEKEGISGTEKSLLTSIFNESKNNRPELAETLDGLYHSIIKVNKVTPDKRKNIMHFLRRMMQFTGPLTAKGIEDTSFYTYNLFIAHNEVGDSPDYYGISHEAFHDEMIIRQKKYPLALNATSTHDTKRGEDFRARLNVLTDIAPDWKDLVLNWKNVNKPYKCRSGRKECPSTNDEYFIYQSLIGGFPVEIMEITTFISRFKDYIIKSIREGKENSSWIKPNEVYENGTLQFIDELINTESDFFGSFLDFFKQVKEYGYLNSLVQVVLKCICPGIPDIYQGCEFWNFSMVDPDNRRKVDFKARKKALKEIRMLGQKPDILRDLWKENDNGKIKLYITYQLLSERAENPDLFTYGSYIPLNAHGDKKDCLFGFIRSYKYISYLIALPLHLASERTKDILQINWKNSYLSGSVEMTGKWYNIFDNQLVEIGETCEASELFTSFPLAILKKG